VISTVLSDKTERYDEHSSVRRVRRALSST
jgi:hypothetical protein